MTFLELASRVLRENRTPMTPDEIWEYARARGYEAEVATHGRTPWRSLGAQLYVVTRDDPQGQFAKTNTRPARFFLRELFRENEDVNALAEQATLTQEGRTRVEYLEKDLHPFLTYYAYWFQKCFTKTIRHNTTARGQFAEWLHPDIVGCYYSGSEWTREVTELSSRLVDPAANPTIISYELKRELNFTNLREAFFQAVSNSSWANQGYLVAANISDDEEFMDELSRLSSAFEIGVIRMDVEDPDSSEILYPAEFRDQLDWETINKLSSNTDFK